MTSFTESVVEDAALEWLRELRYATLIGPAIAAGESDAQRESFAERFRTALASLNPSVPANALDESCRCVTRIDTSRLPPNRIGARADAIMRLAWRRRVPNSAQSRATEALRDALFLKLISGPGRVRDADPFMRARQ